MSAPNAAHAMPQIHTIGAARSLHWPMMHGKRHGISLSQRHHLDTRLHPWTLLRQHKVAAGEIPSRLGQQNRHLNRKYMLAV
jgi:hypothetical protein